MEQALQALEHVRSLVGEMSMTWQNHLFAQKCMRIIEEEIMKGADGGVRPDGDAGQAEPDEGAEG